MTPSRCSPAPWATGNAARDPSTRTPSRPAAGLAARVRQRGPARPRRWRSTSRRWRTPAGSSASGTRSPWPRGPAWPTPTPTPAGTDQALTAHQMLSVDTERLLGPRHPTTLAARDSLAAAFLANGQTREALDRYKSLLADSRGDAADGIIPTRSRPAPAWRRRSPQREAEGRDRRVQAGARGPGADRRADHPDTIAARANLAFAYRSAGQLREAIREYERTLADRERLEGPDHADTRAARCNLAAAYQQAGRVDEAVAAVRARAGRQRAHARPRGPGDADHPRQPGLGPVRRRPR